MNQLIVLSKKIKKVDQVELENIYNENKKLKIINFKF